MDEILKISYIEFENIKKILLDERIQNKRDEYSYYQVEEYINLSFEQRLSLILDRDLMTERNIKSALSNILNNKKYTIEEKNKIFRDNSFFSYIDSVMLTELQNTFYIFPETLNYLMSDDTIFNRLMTELDVTYNQGVDEKNSKEEYLKKKKEVFKNLLV